MNRLGEYIRAEMTWRDWTLRDLSRNTGMDESHLIPILTEKHLVDWPSSVVVEALAETLRVPVLELVLRAAQACGLSVGDGAAGPDLADMTNEDLMRELRRRLVLGASAGNYLTTASSPWLSVVAVSLKKS